MKTLIKIFLLLIVPFSLFTNTVNIYADIADYNITDLNQYNEGNTNRNKDLKEFGEGDAWLGYFAEDTSAFNLMVKIAKDVKNIFFFLATIFLMVIVFRVLFMDNTEEEMEKFKKGVIWITIGIIVMQSAYAYTVTLYDQQISRELGFRFVENIVYPLIGLLEVLASIFFLGVAIMAFYKMITANGDEEKAKSGKMTIVYAIIGFIMIKLAKLIVSGIYGKIDSCGSGTSLISTSTSASCIKAADIHGFAKVMLEVINWMNGFIGIVVIIMIIYAGLQIILSAGDEEKLKKAKSAIIYIVIGLILLAINYLILSFFILPETTI
ncbi:MAG: hypothetical protein PHH06_03085 [Candidatus Gracilibacteria bacterium]|nr:hypothetical protein [Candidatus Gracilibacteria bacterium]